MSSRAWERDPRAIAAQKEGRLRKDFDKDFKDAKHEEAFLEALDEEQRLMREMRRTKDEDEKDHILMQLDGNRGNIAAAIEGELSDDEVEEEELEEEESEEESKGESEDMTRLMKMMKQETRNEKMARASVLMTLSLRQRGGGHNRYLNGV